jgi:eukaryotic-like serine/threonine-protein kinase
MGTMDGLGVGARVGDYIIECELAVKPGLIAWSAKHALLPRRARISTVHRGFAGLQTIAAELTREACILEVLRHAGVPRVFECGLLPDQRPWVASELIEGPSLSLLLAEERRLGVPMVLALLAGVAEILHYAHTRGLVHRNLRPDVIASREEGPCIVDWSDARSRESEALQLAPSDWLAYQPPEVIDGRPADSRADVYALGVIAYEALTGAKPAETAVARRFPAVPMRLAALLERMMAHDALVRPTSAEVRAEALAIVEQLEVPLPQSADEDGIDVQIEDVELRSEPETELDGEPFIVDERARTKTMPPGQTPDLARTWTEPMLPAHRARSRTEAMLPELVSRTKTEPMGPDQVSRTKTEPPATEPEPRLPRTSTRIGKLAPSPRASGTKTH